MSVQIIVNFEGIAGMAAELQAVLAESRDISRRAEGCESFDVFQRDDDPHRFMFLERWTTMEAQDQNMADMFERGQIHRILPLIVGAPDKTVINLIP